MKNTGKIGKALWLKGALVLGVLGFVSCNQSRGGDEKDTKTLAEDYNKAKFESSDKEKDAKFVAHVALINHTEIQLGRLARKRAKMHDVKELGKMMELDHSASQSELKNLAVRKIITLPDSTAAEIKDAYAKLDEKKGIQFDSEYCNMMVKGHKDAIDLFEKESAETTDADIKAFIMSTLPVLRSHLEHSMTCKTKCDKEMDAKGKNKIMNERIK